MSDDARLIAGAMSGTSADGVDVAITRISGHGLGMSAELIHHHHVPYNAGLRNLIFKIRESGNTALGDLGKLGREISLTYAKAAKAALAASRLTGSDLAAVAAHGQTLYHEPPNTIQWLDPSIIAAEVGCAVVSDFRRADLAAGGQGAPLVPFADYILFRHATKNRALLNIGGIANLTLLPAGCALDHVRAFDCGPGNCISDHLCRRLDPGGPGFDVDGAIACSGSLLTAVAERLKQYEYFHRAPPKSTDVPEMIRMFAAAVSESDPVEHQITTAMWLCAWAILREIEGKTDLIVSGGGTRNKFLMRALRDGVDNLMTSDEFGVPSEAKESIAFALLAGATLDGLPSNVPSVTGARRSVVLGSITPRP